MGNCVGSSPKLSEDEQKTRREQQIKTKWIEAQLKNEAKEDNETIKLLFLGAGESGKSTMLKQMRIIYTQDKAEVFTDEERKHFVNLIQSNIIQSTKVLCKQSQLLAAHAQEWGVSTEVSPENKALKDEIMKLTYRDQLNPVLGEKILKLWNDAGIQETFKRRSLFQLNDSTQYFYDRLQNVLEKDYKPSTQDILRARIRTTGIVEHQFFIQDNEFKMYDVGGQRNARKKWIHCFENVTSVIFVAALSGYDQLLYEDNRTNRMHEALNLFDDIIGSQWFSMHSIILFLNKKDIFSQKIEQVPLTVCFPDYVGPQTYEDAKVFIKEAFKAKNSNEERRIYSHYTNATDTENIKRVFMSVQQIILRIHLVDVGLLDPHNSLGDEPREDGADGSGEEYSVSQG